ncbi:MAG: AAA family ATPase [Verrucomicrobia bacterium]|nr:AAA family ATPase [Verrucomicrobiota bacterium]
MFKYLLILLFALCSLHGADICDFAQIYNDRYQFSLPRKDLEDQLTGKAFGRTEPYTEKEFEDLCADINDLYQKILAADPVQERIAVITAGAPGAGKTILMEQILKADQERTGKHFAYTDPDAVCLKHGLKRTYQADIDSGDHSIQARKAAYNKWRPGSNASNNLNLANLIRDGYAIYFGTTATSPHTWRFFDFLTQKHGYKIRLIHISAPDEVRWNSIKLRDREFVQTTEEDTTAKGLLFPERISDTYLKYAEQIDFYYHAAVERDAIHAATWHSQGKSLIIHDPEAYERIKALHNDMVIEKLGKPDLVWEKTVEAK